MQSKLCPSVAAFSLLCASITSAGLRSHLERFEVSQAHMGTMFHIVLYAPGEETAARASQAAFECIARLDDIMSDYRATSELSLLSQRAGSGPVKVSADLFDILCV